MLSSMFQSLYSTPSTASNRIVLSGQPASFAAAPAGGKKSKHPGKAIIAGALAGAIEICITYPTELTKTKLQLFESKGQMGPIGVVKQTIAEEGFFGLYRGLSPLLVFSVPKVASRFFGYEMACNNLRAEDGTMTMGKTLLAGLTAGAIEATVAVTPMERIKTAFIHDQMTRKPADRHYRGLVHGIRTIVAETGFLGLYRGLAATIMKQGGNQATRWVTFTKVKQYFAGGDDFSKLTVFHTIAGGVIAGAVSVYATMPIDVIKSRLQGVDAAKYKGTVDCLLTVVKQEGPLALYKGTTARLARVCADVAIVMVLYEQINGMLDSVWDTSDYDK